MFRFFAERHMLANLIVIMTILLGLNTLTRINRELLPNVDFGMMMITTIYPGASPEDVEVNVTNKIEDELKEIAGIDKTTSLSMKNVPGVGRLQKFGLRSREIRVEVSPRAVKRFQIPLREVIWAIQARRANCRSRRAFAVGEEQELL